MTSLLIGTVLHFHFSTVAMPSVLCWYFVPASWIQDYGPDSILLLLCPSGTLDNIRSIFPFACRCCRLPLQFGGFIGDLFHLSSDLDAELAAAISDLASVQRYEPDWLGFSSFAIHSTNTSAALPPLSCSCHAFDCGGGDSEKILLQSNANKMNIYPLVTGSDYIDRTGHLFRIILLYSGL
jgi:hypothetical protein